MWRSFPLAPALVLMSPHLPPSLPPLPRTLALPDTRAISSKPYLCKNHDDSSSSNSDSPLVPPPTWSIHDLRLLHKDAVAGGGSDALSEEEVGRREAGGTLVLIWDRVMSIGGFRKLARRRNCDVLE